MNDFRGIVGRQVETILHALRSHKELRCREIERAARERADLLRRQSRREARDRVHEAVAEERKRRETAVVQARHQLETEARRRIQARYRELLGRAWPRLVTELNERWQRAEERGQWCELVIDEASRLFAADDWLVEHPDPANGAWSSADTKRLSAALGERNIQDVDTRADPDLEAGLRIRRGGACLDASVAGLLARRAAVEGRLLAQWETGAAQMTRSAE